jgi:dihydroxyacetone kinase
MARGARAAHEAAVDAAYAGAGLSTALFRSGRAWSTRAGGTSGALWGLMIRTLADHLDDDTVPSPDNLVCAARAALDAVTTAGHAAVGDKTLVDALVPYVETLTAAVRGGLALDEAAVAAAEAAARAARDTASLEPKVGRARPLAHLSIGHPDPGAISFAYVIDSVTRVFLHDEGIDHA